MGLCFSLMLHDSHQAILEVKDMSYMTTPVQAARYLHQLKNYDDKVGEFIWHGAKFILTGDGYYKQV